MGSKPEEVGEGQAGLHWGRDPNDLSWAEAHRNENKDLQQNLVHSVLHMQPALDRTWKEK